MTKVFFLDVEREASLLRVEIMDQWNEGVGIAQVGQNKVSEISTNEQWDSQG